MNLLLGVSTVIHSTIASRSYIFATLVTSAPLKDSYYYSELTRSWVLQLLHHGYTRQDLLIIMTGDTETEVQQRVRELKVPIRMVPALSVPRRHGDMDPSYANQATKLWMFNMTQYQTIAYYDSDTYFRRDPRECVESCGPNHVLCAVTNRKDSIHGASYFNAGALIIRPNHMLFHCLYANYEVGSRRPYCEQDMLNDFFCNADGSECSPVVGLLPARCNQQAPGYTHFSSPQTVVLHEVAALVKPHWLDTWPSELRRLVLSKSNTSLIPHKRATRHMRISSMRNIFMGGLRARRSGGKHSITLSPGTSSWHSCEAVRHLQKMRPKKSASPPASRTHAFEPSTTSAAVQQNVRAAAISRSVCSAREDSHNGATMRGGAAVPRRGPMLPPTLSVADLAVGMLLPRLKPSTKRSLFMSQDIRSQLAVARETWMAHAVMVGTDFAMLVDCPRGASSVPANWMVNLSSSEARSSGSHHDLGAESTERGRFHWRCYAGATVRGRSRWRKTQALVMWLLQLPPRQFYLKVDPDALVRAVDRTSSNVPVTMYCIAIRLFLLPNVAI